jgi:two-component system phosphate regulon sensor histidine kinase PhoR
MQTSTSRRWSTLVLYGMAVIAIMLAARIFVSRTIETVLLRDFDQRIQAQADTLAQNEPLAEDWQDPERLRTHLGELQELTGARITALDDAATVLADSSAFQPLESANLSALPEVSPAVWEEDQPVRRIDPVTGQDSIFIVRPLAANRAGASGSLRFAFPIAPVQERIAALQRQLILVGALTTFAILVVFLYQLERSRRTVRQLIGVADRITAGELDARILALNTGEMGQLTRSFNRMAGALESEIQKREREKDRLNTVMHSMADGVLILTRKGKVRMVNPAAAYLLNTDERRAHGRTFIQVVRDHRIAEVWTRCRATGQQQVAALDLGPSRFLRVVVTPFLRGADRGYVVILQDLTRLRQLQTVRQDFVSNVSHELRTPLAALRALVDTLRDGAIDDPPAAARFLDRMEVEVDSLTQLVEELFELSRIESGKVPLRFRRASAQEVVGGGAERLRPQAGRTQIALQVEIAEETPDLLIDPDRVQQVITNLVHNAIKFTPAGGQIDVAVRPLSETAVLVSVADTGTGIPPHELRRIFERFYKTDRARSGGGTGLGLAIAKHIVQSHGGEIWAESVVDFGSTFYLTLPSAPASVDQEQRSSAPPLSLSS